MDTLEDVQMQIHGAVLVILSLGNLDATMLDGIVTYHGRRADHEGRLSFLLRGQNRYANFPQPYHVDASLDGKVTKRRQSITGEDLRTGAKYLT